MNGYVQDEMGKRQHSLGKGVDTGKRCEWQHDNYHIDPQCIGKQNVPGRNNSSSKICDLEDVCAPKTLLGAEVEEEEVEKTEDVTEKIWCRRPSH